MRMSDELQRKLEHALLGGPRRYTRLEVAAKSGVSPERARQLWRALGFASISVVSLSQPASSGRC